MALDPRPSPVRAPSEDEVVREHLPLVEHEVTALLRRLPAHVQRDDLVCAGRAALLLAVRAYEPAHGVPFPRYAARRVAGALLDELRSVDWASRSVRRRAREQEEAAEVLCRRLGREATSDEVARHLGVPAAEVARTQADVHRSLVLSWQAVVAATGDEPALPGVEPSPETVLVHRERDAYLHDAMAELPERLRRVMTALYVDERSVTELAAELGVTESRVSQIRTEALSLLREGLAAPLSQEPPADAPAAGTAARRRAAYRTAVVARSSWQSRLSVSAGAPVVAHSA